MPLRQQFAASREDTEATPAEEQPEPDVAEVPEAEPATSRRRWNPFRRRAKATESELVSTPVDAEPDEPETKPAPRVPVGKASRSAPVTRPDSVTGRAT